MRNKIIIMVISLFLFSSCSRLDVAIGLANTYLVNKVDDYFDLTRQQSRWLSHSLKNDIEQFKKVIFPQMAAEMIKIADMISTQKVFEPATISLSYQRLENLFLEGVRIFSPTAVAFVDMLSDKQLEVFKDESNEKISELKLDVEKKSYNKMKKQFDSWIGSMTSDQKNEIKTFVDINPGPAKMSAHNREVLAYGFTRAFPDKATRRKYVEKIFNQYQSMKEASYAQAIEEHKKKNYIFVARFLTKLTEDQKNTLIETIRDRANQLLKISKG